MLVRSAYIAPTMEEARRVAGQGIVAPFAYNDPFRGLDIFLNPGEKQTPDMKLDWDFLEPRNLLVGPPDHVIERIEETREITGIDHIMIGYDHPGVPSEEDPREPGDVRHEGDDPLRGLGGEAAQHCRGLLIRPIPEPCIEPVPCDLSP